MFFINYEMLRANSELTQNTQVIGLGSRHLFKNLHKHLEHKSIAFFTIKCGQSSIEMGLTDSFSESLVE
jgi:hypothetical protein